jgi:Cu+-exporting ATPase
MLWFPDYHTAMGVFTAVLIVACPCALALSVPFTLGNALRILGRNKFFVKNTLALEELAKINHIVFDKTGTITETGTSEVSFAGVPLSDFQKDMVKSLTRNSTHPLSRGIYDSITSTQLPDITSFTESAGKGIEGIIYGNSVKLGSVKDKKEDNASTKVYLQINNEILGYFKFSNSYRSGANKVISDLSKNYKLALLSGDNEGEKENLLKLFNNESSLYFRQSPEDKLSFIEKIKAYGSKVLMIGDGLNDAGALSKSNVGIAVTEDISSFSPACDVIMEASVFNRLPDFISFAVSAKKIIRWSFIISLSYNLAGLSFAVDGMLSPVVAAILMPLSSVSMVLYTTIATNLTAKRKRL